jgi:hypothetical protein
MGLKKLTSADEGDDEGSIINNGLVGSSFDSCRNSVLDLQGKAEHARRRKQQRRWQEGQREIKISLFTGEKASQRYKILIPFVDVNALTM